MPVTSHNKFSAVWVLDFEFEAPSGSNPKPVCLVACELRTGQTIRLWRDALLGPDRPPRTRWAPARCSSRSMPVRNGVATWAGLAPAGQRLGPVRRISMPDERPEPFQRAGLLRGVGVVRAGQGIRAVAQTRGESWSCEAARGRRKTGRILELTSESDVQATRGCSVPCGPGSPDGPA